MAGDGPDVVAAAGVEMLHGGIPPYCDGQFSFVRLEVLDKAGDVLHVVIPPAEGFRVSDLGFRV